MITPTATNFAGRLLALTVDAGEDGLSVDQAASHLFKPPKFPPTVGTRAEKDAAYRMFRVDYEVHKTSSCNTTSRTFGRLQERKLVETRGAPRLSSWFLDRAERHGYQEAMRGAMNRIALEHGLADVDPDAPKKPKRGTKPHAEMSARMWVVEKLLREKPPTVKALLGNQPDGALLRTWAWLSEHGIVVPPSQRVATDGGVELVMKWRSP